MQWLDHWLKDADNGDERAPKVILFVKGVDRWRTEADWPIPDARVARLFVQARQATVGRPNGDQREAEAKVLTWTTPPVPVATEVTGYPHVSLWAASSPTDGTWCSA